MRALFAITIAAACLTACNSSTTPSDSQLRVTTVVSAAVVHAGDVVTIRTTVTNVGDTPRSIMANACPEQFEVKAADGTVVGPGVRLCTASSTVKVLEPGDSVTFTDQWNGDGLPVSGTIANQPILPAGTYHIVARWFPGSDQSVDATIEVVR